MTGDGPAQQPDGLVTDAADVELWPDQEWFSELAAS